jgi:hypothetical protein
MRNALLGGVGVALALGMTPAMADWNLTTGVQNNPLGPQFIITFAADGSISTAVNPAYASDPGPFITEDAYYGVINDTSKALSAFHLTSTGPTIGGFDADGINPYADFSGTGAGVGWINPWDAANGNTGYGGHDAFFTNNTISALTVNFAGGISANGGTDVFSLENATTLNSVVVTGVPEPSTWAMMALGFAGLGFAGYRSARKSAVAI